MYRRSEASEKKVETLTRHESIFSYFNERQRWNANNDFCSSVKKIPSYTFQFGDCSNRNCALYCTNTSMKRGKISLHVKRVIIHSYFVLSIRKHPLGSRYVLFFTYRYVMTRFHNLIELPDSSKLLNGREMRVRGNCEMSITPIRKNTI